MKTLKRLLFLKKGISKIIEKFVTTSSHLTIPMDADGYYLLDNYTRRSFVHPSVINLPGGFNNTPWIKYIMAITPYPKGKDTHEDPEIFLSKDGRGWQPINWYKRPVLPPISTSIRHRSDPELVYANDMIHMFWRETNKGTNTSEIFTMSSYDLHFWTTPQVILSDNHSSSFLLSPAVIYDGIKYHMWTCDGHGSVYYRTTTDTSSWSSKELCSLSNPELFYWHIGATQENNKILFVLQTSSGPGGATPTRLYLGESLSDYKSIDVSNTELVTRARSSVEENLYKGHLVKEEGNIFRLYYTGISGTVNNTLWTTMSKLIKIDSTSDFIDISETRPLPPHMIWASQGDEKLKLRWSKFVSDDLLGYNVYVNGVKHNTNPITEEHYTVSPLVNDTNYYFNITSVTSSSESAKSAPLISYPTKCGEINITSLTKFTADHSDSINISEEISLEAYIAPYPYTGSESYTIVEKPQPSHLDPFYIYGLYLTPGGITPHGIRFDLSINGVRKSLEAPIDYILKDTYVKITGTYDGTNMRIYADGFQVGWLNAPGTIGTSVSPISIASHGNISVEPYLGKLSFIRIWSKALSMGEIQDMGNKQLITNNPLLRANWKFGDGPGTTLNDSSIYGNNAQLTSGYPEWTLDVPENIKLNNYNPHI